MATGGGAYPICYTSRQVNAYRFFVVNSCPARRFFCSVLGKAGQGVNLQPEQRPNSAQGATKGPKKSQRLRPWEATQTALTVL